MFRGNSPIRPAPARGASRPSLSHRPSRKTLPTSCGRMPSRAIRSPTVFCRSSPSIRTMHGTVTSFDGPYFRRQPYRCTSIMVMTPRLQGRATGGWRLETGSWGLVPNKPSPRPSPVKRGSSACRPVSRRQSPVLSLPYLPATLRVPSPTPRRRRSKPRCGAAAARTS